MGEDPNELMMQIRSIQQSLTELQHQVIRGQIKPDEYRQVERERIQEIHKLEERLAVAMGTKVPDRETDL